MSGKQEYLGDGVYAGYDGYSIVLSTNDGIRDTNIIYLEPRVFAALNAYAARASSQGGETT